MGRSNGKQNFPLFSAFQTKELINFQESGCLPTSWQRTSHFIASPVSSVIDRGEYFHSSFSDPCQDGDHNLYLQVTHPSPPQPSGMWSPRSTELPQFLAAGKEKSRNGGKFDLQHFQRRFSTKTGRTKSPGSGSSVYGFDNLAYSPGIETENEEDDDEPPVCDNRLSGIACAECDESEKREGEAERKREGEIVCHQEYLGEACQCGEGRQWKKCLRKIKAKKAKRDEESSSLSVRIGESNLVDRTLQRTARLRSSMSLKTNEIWRAGNSMMVKQRSGRRASKAKRENYRQETLKENPVVYSSVLKNYDLAFTANSTFIMTPDGIEEVL